MKLFQIGFKAKLAYVIALTALGFSVIAYLAFSALQVLDDAANKVTLINHNVNLIKDIELDVLRLEARAELQSITAFEQTSQQLIQQLIANSSVPQTLQVQLIEDKLKLWAKLKTEAIRVDEMLGTDIHQGLRGAVFAQLNLLKTGLFSSFTDDYNGLQQSVTAFNDGQNDAEYQTVQRLIDDMNIHAKEMGLDDLIAPKLATLEQTVKALAAAVLKGSLLAEQINSANVKLLQQTQSVNVLLTEQLLFAKNNALMVSADSKTKVLSISLVIALLVIFLLYTISREVTGALVAMSKVLNKLAGGDLTQRLAVNTHRNDELDKVCAAVNEMASALSKVLVKVLSSSQSLDSGALNLRENLVSIVSANVNTNEKTTHVASAIEQISSTMATMSIATSAALVQTQNAQKSADDGSEVINSAAASMLKLSSVFDDLNSQAKSLEGASSKIDNVTDMINNLAGQTNLLALNAAIEAARAGEAGRGFSVVADEVRSLAGQTVQATQDIDNIIRAMHDSTQSLLKAMVRGTGYISNGSALGEDAAGAINQIKTLVREVTDRNQELTFNIEEASIATASIAQNIDSLAGNVAHNSQQSIEVQNYVDEVSNRATELLQMTNQFKFQ